eukprot:15342317-Ditylum_brightwellii.AAC.1
MLSVASGACPSSPVLAASPRRKITQTRSKKNKSGDSNSDQGPHEQLQAKRPQLPVQPMPQIVPTTEKKQSFYEKIIAGFACGSQNQVTVNNPSNPQLSGPPMVINAIKDDASVGELTLMTLERQDLRTSLLPVAFGGAGLCGDQTPRHLTNGPANGALES